MLRRFRLPALVAATFLLAPVTSAGASEIKVLNAGKLVELRVGQGYNYSQTQETLGNPYGLMGRAAFEQMKLNAA